MVEGGKKCVVLGKKRLAEWALPLRQPDVVVLLPFDSSALPETSGRRIKVGFLRTAEWTHSPKVLFQAEGYKRTKLVFPPTVFPRPNFHHQTTTNLKIPSTPNPWSITNLQTTNQAARQAATQETPVTSD